MSKAKLQRWVRRLHRYLGVMLGLQFLAWTLGGLYFSWTQIESVRGEDLRAAKKPLPVLTGGASLAHLLDSMKKAEPAIVFRSIQVTDILGKCYYQIQVDAPLKGVFLFDMQTLQQRDALSEQEAIKVAQESINVLSELAEVEYITHTHAHHEYRGKVLPAYAVSFGAPANTTVYVASELGTVQSYRSNTWRIFDFLWMLHTMDYEGRDNFNNWLLRIFSIFGLMSIFSGFLLYFLTWRYTSFRK